MLDLYFWPTGNGKKITILLEECGLEYRVIPVNIGKGDQFTPEFEAISPNNKMPAIVDRDVQGKPIVIFESGAILQYLAEKTGKLMPQDIRGKYRVVQWLYWQVGGLGPMGGQAHFFLRYAPQKVPFAMDRFRGEVARLYAVLDKQLAWTEYLAGEYSIADIASWPWVARWEWQEQNLDVFPNIRRWFDAIGARPAVKRALAVGADWANFNQQMSEEDSKRLFNLRDQDFGAARS
jgi:GST-like protein